MDKKTASQAPLSTTSFSLSQKISVLLLLLLASEFLLGMYSNLYVTIPKYFSNSGSFLGMGNMMMGPMGSLSPVFITHMMMGPIIIGISLVSVVLAFISRNRVDTVFTAIGFLSVIVSGWAGLAFLGNSQNSYSLTMASGFLISFIAYFSQLVWGNKNIVTG